MSKQNQPKFKTMCGGQALIEGIMMRGPKKQAVVVRRPDGELEIQEKDLKFIKDKYPVLGWPLIRGVVNFADSMYSGVTALMYSAEFFPEDGEEEEAPSKFETWLNDHLGTEKFTALITSLAVILGLCMSIGLFFLLPTVLGGLVSRVFPGNMLVRNLAESLLKLLIFVAYLAMCSHMGEMKRVFSYHGAEHKTIFCYEAGLPLTVDNVRIQPRLLSGAVTPPPSKSLAHRMIIAAALAAGVSTVRQVAFSQDIEATLR